MDNATHRGRPVVVGVDGSQSAIQAARWAIDEAIIRDVPLRLVHVTHEAVQPATLASADNERLAFEYGENALRLAHEAVAASGKSVKVETTILRGDPTVALAAESHDADMICVGSVGIGRLSPVVLGSTAAGLAKSAQCPVAIVRTWRTPLKPDNDWIAVPINDSPDNDDVVAQAMDEAQLRHAGVLALGVRRTDLGETPYDQLDRRVQAWRRRYPDVHVCPISTRSGIAGFLADNDERIQLAVIGSSDADQVVELIGPHAHPIHGHAEFSVALVVRTGS
jgi:nucleotide-binding universal stress UspA family protein